MSFAVFIATHVPGIRNPSHRRRCLRTRSARCAERTHRRPVPHGWRAAGSGYNPDNRAVQHRGHVGVIREVAHGELRQVCWVVWVIGIALIVGSWIDLVPPVAGWAGWVLAVVGAAVSYLPQREDRSAIPLTQEGLPVEPSGVPVPPDVPLEPGMPLLAYSQGKWWRATVVTVEAGDVVVVGFPGWDQRRRERVPRKHLQIDPDPTRVPLRLPPEGWLDRRPPSNPNNVRPGGSPGGVTSGPEDRRAGWLIALSLPPAYSRLCTPGATQFPSGALSPSPPRLGDPFMATVKELHVNGARRTRRRRRRPQPAERPARRPRT